MAMDFFVATTGILAPASVALAFKLRSLINERDEAQMGRRQAREHVSDLQEMLHKISVENAQLIRQRDELNEIVTKVHDQRNRALRKAHEKNRAANETKAAVKAEATVKTFSALKAAPLRPREEVVASIRSSKAAQAVSSAG